ncbi:hypothetical protein BGZ57DRAFT_855451 [Hyaloscypha finlandica]|nr:hypothetical protein BGZ57DRAFT_855451 [Hyaloscypha finlandica]
MVELLAQEGQPDPSRLFDSLESHSIILSEEVSSLRTEYSLEREPVLQGYLDTTVSQVVKGIGHVLGKHTLDDDDSIIVNSVVELSCSVFDRLYSREWLNYWDITAALEMIDRPVFIGLGLSVPVYKKEANGEVTPLANPLRY